MASLSRGVSRRIFMLTASAALAGPALADPPVPPPAQLTEPAPLRPEDVSRMGQALDHAGDHGLDAKALTPPGLDALVQSQDPDKRKRGEVMLRAAVLRYARQVRSGRLEGPDFDDEWAIRPAAFDPRPELEAALEQNRKSLVGCEITVRELPQNAGDRSFFRRRKRKRPFGRSDHRQRS